MRCDVDIPIAAEILHLGIADPKGAMGLHVLAAPREIDPITKQPKPYAKDELRSIEVLVASAGNTIPDNAKFRASAMGPGGLVLMFEIGQSDNRIVTLGGKR